MQSMILPGMKLRDAQKRIMLYDVFWFSEDADLEAAVVHSFPDSSVDS